MLGNEPACGKESNNGFVWQRHTSTILYSCYISPNADMTDFSDFLARLGASLESQAANQDILVTGDFNSASPTWGSSRRNARGQILEEFIAEHNLTIHNTGLKPTFQRGSQTSHLDLTITNERMKSKIRHWTVLEDLESLSDHNYISFQIEDTAHEARRRRPRIEKELDFDRCKQELETRLRGKELTAGVLTREVMKACNAATLEKPQRIKRAYWYTETIAEIRRECIKSRRKFLRADPENRVSQKEQYKLSRSNLNRAIRSSKEEIWRKLCEDVSRNPWGTAYKIIMNRLNIPKAAPPREMLRATLDTLFPDHVPESQVAGADWSRLAEIQEVTDEEMEITMKKIAPRKAPGPDKIPGKITKYIIQNFRKEYRDVINEILRTRTFPKSWKKANVVLIKKPGKPAELPNSYRPICLLSTLGKSLESILNQRLIKELEEKQVIHDNQYGFRKGRSTIQAIKKLTAHAELEFDKSNLGCRKLVLAILIDVKNAFNSLSWTAIKSSLRANEITEDLTTLLESYFRDREISSGGVRKQMSAGVPQGSIIGPTLWNLAYNGVFKLRLPHGCEIIGYADDIVIVIKDTDEKIVESRGIECIEQVERYLSTLKLEMAPQKSEAIIFTRKRVVPQIRLEHNGNKISINASVKYLGITLDRKLTYVKHIETACQKAAKVANDINRILPRTSSTDEANRKLLAKVGEQIVAYGAPVWDEALKLGKIKDLLTKTQRVAAIRVSRAYRTVFTPGVLVIGRLIPWNIKFGVRRDIRTGVRTNPGNFEEECIDIWQENWSAPTDSSKGARIKKLIPSISRWYHRNHGELTYELTQYITGHGAFRAYLKRIGKRQSSTCNLCESGEEDDADHAIFHCRYFNAEREKWKELTDHQITEENIIDKMIESENCWEATADFIKHVVSTKEALDRIEERLGRSQLTELGSEPDTEVEFEREESNASDHGGEMIVD